MHRAGVLAATWINGGNPRLKVVERGRQFGARGVRNDARKSKGAKQVRAGGLPRHALTLRRTAITTSIDAIALTRKGKADELVPPTRAG